MKIRNVIISRQTKNGSFKKFIKIYNNFYDIEDLDREYKMLENKLRNDKYIDVTFFNNIHEFVNGIPRVITGENMFYSLGDQSELQGIDIKNISIKEFQNKLYQDFNEIQKKIKGPNENLSLEYIDTLCKLAMACIIGKSIESSNYRNQIGIKNYTSMYFKILNLLKYPFYFAGFFPMIYLSTYNLKYLELKTVIIWVVCVLGTLSSMTFFEEKRKFRREFEGILFLYQTICFLIPLYLSLNQFDIYINENVSIIFKCLFFLLQLTLIKIPYELVKNHIYKRYILNKEE